MNRRSSLFLNISVNEKPYMLRFILYNMDISFNERQKQNAIFATTLNHILISAKCQTFSITHRAKTDASIANKLSRFGETPNQILDLYGIRVVTPTRQNVEQSQIP